MKVKKVHGNDRVYEFEDGEYVPFFDKQRYNEKLKQGNPEKPKETVTVAELVSEKIEEEAVQKRRPGRPRTKQ